MNYGSRFVRDLLMLLTGAAVGALFAVLIAYPELLGDVRENTARIEANQTQIALLWEAHQVEHEPTTPDGGSAP